MTIILSPTTGKRPATFTGATQKPSDALSVVSDRSGGSPDPSRRIRLPPPASLGRHEKNLSCGSEQDRVRGDDDFRIVGTRPRRFATFRHSGEEAAIQPAERVFGLAPQLRCSEGILRDVRSGAVFKENKAQKTDSETTVSETLLKGLCVKQICPTCRMVRIARGRSPPKVAASRFCSWPLRGSAPFIGSPAAPLRRSYAWASRSGTTALGLRPRRRKRRSARRAGPAVRT